MLASDDYNLKVVWTNKTTKLKQNLDDKNGLQIRSISKHHNLLKHRQNRVYWGFGKNKKEQNGGHRETPTVGRIMFDRL